MTRPNNGQPPRKGFLASLSAALTPQPIPDDDTGPLTPPKGVLVSVVLAIIAGGVFVLAGVIGIAGIDDAVATAKTGYSKQVQECTTAYGGIGTSAVTATSPTGTAAVCQQLPALSDTYWDSARTASIVVSAVFIAMGVLLVVGGWFLRAGATWARRSIVGVAIVVVLASLLLGMSSPIVLGATLLIMVAVVLCYLSSGATYFLRVKARRHT